MKPRNLIETASIAAAAVLALGLAGSVPAAPILNVMTNDTYASLTFNITSDGSGQIKFYDLNNGSPNGNRLSGFQLMDGASGYAAWATTNAGGQTPS